MLKVVFKVCSRYGQGCVLKVCSRLLQPCSRYAQGMLKVVRQGCVLKAPQGMCAKVACSSLLKVCVLKVACSRFCPHQRLCPQPTHAHAPIEGRPTSAPTPYSATELSVATYRELQIDGCLRLMHSDWCVFQLQAPNNLMVATARRHRWQRPIVIGWPMRAGTFTRWGNIGEPM